MINYYNKTKSIEKVLKTYNICRKTLFNWRQKYKKGVLFDKIKYKQHIISKYSNEIKQYVKKYIINKDNFKMKNLLRTIKRKFNCSFNSNNVYYLFSLINITFKKAHKIVRINKKKHKKMLND